MNLPNKLTILRICLTFVFLYFIFSPGLWAKVLTIFVFIMASLSDYYDGWLARKRNLITNFGKLMDPIADKILVLSAFIAFVQLKLMPAWMVIIILSRELLITGIRLLSATNAIILAASKEGKHKTVSQLSSISLILSFLLYKEIALNLGLWTNLWEVFFKRTVFALLFVTTCLTFISGISFLYKNRNLLGIK